MPYQILAAWLACDRKPNDATLWRWLDRGVELGLAIRIGKGTKTEPYRYGQAVSVLVEDTEERLVVAALLEERQTGDRPVEGVVDIAAGGPGVRCAAWPNCRPHRPDATVKRQIAASCFPGVPSMA